MTQALEAQLGLHLVLWELARLRPLRLWVTNWEDLFSSSTVMKPLTSKLWEDFCWIVSGWSMGMFRRVPQIGRKNIVSCFSANSNYPGTFESSTDWQDQYNCDNLKKLFRSLAMTAPDSTMIAEVTLFSQGFRTAEKLARNIVPFFR